MKEKNRPISAYLSVGLSVVVIALCFFPVMALAEEGDLPFAGTTIRCLLERHPSVFTMQRLLPEFEKETGMRVIIETPPDPMNIDKINLALSQRSSDYDVIMAEGSWCGIGWYRAGYLEPLKNFIDDPTIDNSNLDLDDFMEKFLDAATELRDGTLFGLPLYGESTFLMYRKDVFAKLGLQAPATMDDLELAASKITENTDMYGITVRARRGIHAVYIWRGFWQAYGAEKWFDKDMKPLLNAPAAIEGTELYARLIKKYAPAGVLNFGWTENRVFFEQGRAAMTIDATVNGALAEDPASSVAGKVGYAAVPKAKIYGSSIASHALFISSFSKNKKAAWAFIKWATDKDTQLRSFEMDPHSGVTVKSVLLGEVFKNQYPTFADGLIQAVEMGNADYLPRVPEAMEIIDKVGIYLSEILSGGKSVKEALDDANEEIYKVMEDSGYYE